MDNGLEGAIEDYLKRIDSSNTQISFENDQETVTVYYYTPDKNGKELVMDSYSGKNYQEILDHFMDIYNSKKQQ